MEVPTRLPQAKLLSEDVACPICGMSDWKLREDSGRIRARCRTCSSRERHRAFFDAFRRRVGALLPVTSKRVLGIRLHKAEKRLLQDLAGIPITNLATVGASLDSSIELASASFDVIYCSDILSRVRDVDSVLLEIERILAPDGVLYLYEPIKMNAPTREITDPEEIMSSKDEEGVRRLRIFGAGDLIGVLSKLFHVEVLKACDPVCHVTCHYFVAGKRPLPKEPFLSPKEQMRISCVVRPTTGPGTPPFRCTICASEFNVCIEDEKCPACGQASRTRSLPVFLRDHLANLLERPLSDSLPLLCFSLTMDERRLVETYYRRIMGVALYGSYERGERREGNQEVVVDARDLSRFNADSFSGVFSIGVYDYFEEQEQALSEAYRVIAPGGAFMTLILAHRVRLDDEGPFVTHTVKRRGNYHPYLPDGVELPSITVGREWYVNAMRAAGFQAQAIDIFDPASGITNTWFLGKKSLDSGKRGSL